MGGFLTMKSVVTTDRTKPRLPSRLQTSSAARVVPRVVPRHLRRIGSLSCMSVGKTSASTVPPANGVVPHVPGGGVRCRPLSAALVSATPPGPTNCLNLPFAQVVPLPLPVSQFNALQYGLAPKPFSVETDVDGEIPISEEKMSEVPDASSRRNACQSAPLWGAALQAATPFEQPLLNRLLQFATRAVRSGPLHMKWAESAGLGSPP